MSQFVKNISLPQNWEWCKAQDYIDIRDGTHDSPKYVEKGYPLVTSKNLINGKIDFSTCSFITKEDHDAISKRSAVDDGDILYAMIGTIGNPVIVDKKHEFSIKNVALFKFKNNRVLNKYIYYFLNSDLTKRQFSSNSRGGTQQFVSLKNIRDLNIPLPPLPEQQKIASILEAADSLRQKDQQLIEKYTALSQSLFLEMFGDPVSNPMEWNFSRIADLTEGKTLNGFFAKKEHYVESGTPIVWITDFINKIYVETDDLRRVSIKQDDIYKYKLAYGDVLFCRSSLTVEGIGKCAIVPKSITQDVLFECHIIKVRLGAQVLPEYFRFLSNTSYFRSKVMKSAKTSTMTTISQDGITDILIPIPPIALQNQFAERIQSIEAQKQLALASLKKSEALFNSLLQRAFKGELTT